MWEVRGVRERSGEFEPVPAWECHSAAQKSLFPFPRSKQTPLSPLSQDPLLRERSMPLLRCRHFRVQPTPSRGHHYKSSSRSRHLVRLDCQFSVSVASFPATYLVAGPTAVRSLRFCMMKQLVRKLGRAPLPQQNRPSCLQTPHHSIQ